MVTEIEQLVLYPMCVFTISRYNMSNPYSIILAPNPSIETGPGTNTIVVDGGDAERAGAMVIDPANDNPEHLNAIIHEGNLRGGIRRILLTHGHPDHIGGAEILGQQLGVPICGYSRRGIPFLDEEIPDNTAFPAGNDILRALYTPGHRFDHLSFFLEQQHILFAGDLVASKSTVVIPTAPEGDMFDYINSLKRLQSLEITEIVPAHGLIISNPEQKLSDYIRHRMERERQVLSLLERYHPQGLDIPTLVQHIYANIDSQLHRLAAQSVEAHLLKLEREGRVHRTPQKSPTSLGIWYLVVD
jgi:glyoxylase-like metal-dependent hydrolase (beta-lactamase superfamily II)